MLSVNLLVCFAYNFAYGIGTFSAPGYGVPDDGDYSTIVKLNNSSAWSKSFDILVSMVASEHHISSKFVNYIEVDDFHLVSDII